MKKATLSLALLTSSLIVSCQPNLQVTQNLEQKQNIKLNKSIEGFVNFPENKAFSIKATQSDLVTQASVSLLLPPDKPNANSTIAVGLTDSSGKFKINPDFNFNPQIGDIYILEARKRLGGGGNGILTLKTFIKWESTGWNSITGGVININTKTTSLCVMSDYNTSIMSPNETIGKISLVNGVSVLSDINSSVNAQKISEVDNLVTLSLNNNEDPTHKITYSNNFLNYNNNSVFYVKQTPVAERSDVLGKIYDPNGVPVVDAVVNAKSIDPAVNWIGTPQITTTGGNYVFRSAPVGVPLEITVSKDGWTTRKRNEVLVSNLQNSSTVNIFDFSGINAIQDEPEIVSLKVNGLQFNSSSNGDAFSTATNTPKNSKPTPVQMDNGAQISGIGNVPSLTGISSSSIEIEMTFSEPIKVADIQNNFRLSSQSGFDNRATSFVVDGNYSGVEFVVSPDEKVVTFKTNKAILSNRGGDEARYLIDFTQSFRDKTDKAAIDRRYFRFGNTQINDFAVFSVRNDIDAPKLLSISAIDGGSANDIINLRFSEPMELINQASYTSGLADPIAPSNLSRQLWYRDANTVMANAVPIAGTISDNNATLIGFLNNSDSDPMQFRASYMIGKILSSQINNSISSTIKISALGLVTRTPNTTPLKGNTTSNDLLRFARISGSNISIEFSPTAFDADDRVIVSVGNRITGNYIDRNKTPNINDDLSVSVSGSPVEYANIYDPAGLLVSTGNLSTSANIDVSDNQKVATAMSGTGGSGGGTFTAIIPTISSLSRTPVDPPIGIMGDTVSITGTNLNVGTATIRFYTGPTYQSFPSVFLDKPVVLTSSTSTNAVTTIPVLTDSEINQILGRPTGTIITNTDRQNIVANIIVSGTGGMAQYTGAIGSNGN